MRSLQYLRNRVAIIRWVLVLFALSIGIAVASPLVKPQSMELICSGLGSVKLINNGDDGKSAGPSHSLDCPLCVTSLAPPSVVQTNNFNEVLDAFALPLEVAAGVEHRYALAPPARAPPVNS